MTAPEIQHEENAFEAPPDCNLDITAYVCPMTFVKTKLQLVTQSLSQSSKPSLSLSPSQSSIPSSSTPPSTSSMPSTSSVPSLTKETKIKNLLVQQNISDLDALNDPSSPQWCAYEYEWKWITENPRPEIREVAGIVEQIAEGLRVLHRRETLHQDLKPWP